jgi:hypothetical protein
MPATLADRTQGPLTLAVSAYGVHFGVRVGDPAIAEDLPNHLPPGSTYDKSADIRRMYSFSIDTDRSGRQQYAVYLDGALLARYATLQGALFAFEADVQLYVAEMAPDCVFVHAGVVGCKGRAILLPGRSLSGKSTLVEELIRAGADYYSDEYAVLDSAGGVHPYARPLSVRRPGVTKRPVNPADGHAAKKPIPVGLVVVSAFRPGGEWRPQRLSPGRGVLALLANTVSARRIPDIVLARLHQVVSDAPVVASERGEASHAVDSILEWAIAH